MGSSAPSIQPMSLALGSSSSTLSSSAVNGNVDGWQDLPSLLASHPHSEFGLDAANDSTIRINFRKVWKPEGLVVVLYIFNKVSRAVSGTTQLDIQGMRLISSIGFGDGNVSTSLVDNLTANGYARHVLTLTTSQPAAGMVLRGQHTYIDGPPRTVYFTVPIAANDFLRLHPLTVQEFGVCWEKFSAERKQRISPSCITSMEMLQERVGRDVGISAIQAIGKELICSAQILEESSSLCLLHIAVLTKGIEVTVHSSAMPISEFVVRHCASVWKA